MHGLNFREVPLEGLHDVIGDVISRDVIGDVMGPQSVPWHWGPLKSSETQSGAVSLCRRPSSWLRLCDVIALRHAHADH